MRIKVPATSANVGPGFDCLGIAFDIYNTFDVRLADRDILHHTETRFCNPDNLFLRAYHKACRKMEVESFVEADFNSDIPVSRGLGSSAALIVGGIVAANELNGRKLSEEDIFLLASEMEGHPDNAAPAFFGGLTACLKDGDTYLARNLSLHEDWRFTVLIPDFEVSTEEARGILPAVYPRADAASNGAHAILTCEALRTGDLSLLKAAAKDLIHEPYRRTLIHDFDIIRDIAEEDTDGVFLISGSGSTCLLISKRPLSEDAEDMIRDRKDPAWKVLAVKPAFQGCEVYEE